jgi:hypothetical protein
LSIEDAHPLGNVSQAAKIEQSQQKTVQNRQKAGSGPFADLTMIFAQCDISSMVEQIFNRPELSLQA